MPSVLIIGASRGIGREFVTQYHAEGWDVHATARQDSDIADLKAAGAAAYRADTSDETTLETLATDLATEFDLIVVNAGVGSETHEATPADIDSADWERVMRVNALGPLLVARRLGGRIKKGGTFAVLSSVMGSIAENGMGGFYSYRMSKAALNAGLKSLSLAMENDGIGVIALHPGWVKTDMGGANADIDTAQSVSGLRSVLAAKAPKDGRLFVNHKGEDLPW